MIGNIVVRLDKRIWNVTQNTIPQNDSCGIKKGANEVKVPHALNLKSHSFTAFGRRSFERKTKYTKMGIKIGFGNRKLYFSIIFF